MDYSVYYDRSEIAIRSPSPKRRKFSTSVVTKREPTSSRKAFQRLITHYKLQNLSRGGNSVQVIGCHITQPIFKTEEVVVKKEEWSNKCNYHHCDGSPCTNPKNLSRKGVPNVAVEYEDLKFKCNYEHPAGSPYTNVHTRKVQTCNHCEYTTRGPKLLKALESSPTQAFQHKKIQLQNMRRKVQIHIASKETYRTEALKLCRCYMMNCTEML